MNGSGSLSAVKGLKLLKPHKNLGQSLYMLQGNTPSLPSPTPSSPLHTPVCIQRVSACVRKAKDPTKLFSLFSFQKNGPIHSCNRWENFLSGSLETAKSGKQQPASAASVVIGPNNNKKTATTTTTTTTKHATCAQAHTHKHAHRTKPNGQGFKEELLSYTFRQQGRSLGTEPWQPSSQPPHHLSSAFCLL